MRIRSTRSLFPDDRPERISLRRKRIYWLASLLLLSLPLSLSADDVVPFEIDDYASVTPFRERASRLRKEGRFEEAEKLRTKLGETLRRSGIHYYAAWQFYYAGQSHREIGAESLAEKSYLQAIGQIEAESGAVVRISDVYEPPRGISDTE
jgi:hypothetical protein